MELRSDHLAAAAAGWGRARVLNGDLIFSVGTRCGDAVLRPGAEKYDGNELGSD